MSSAAILSGLRAGKTSKWGKWSRPSLGKMVTALFLMTPYEMCLLNKKSLTGSSSGQVAERVLHLAGVGGKPGERLLTS